MNADMRLAERPAAAANAWHAVYYPVNVEAFSRQMEIFDRMRRTEEQARKISATRNQKS